jgi:hypothetical protein
MRKISIISLFLIVVLASGCGNGRARNDRNSVSQKTDTGTAIIAFREYEHNFGKVEEGEKVGHIFIFSNKGTGSLVMASATTSCGCTVSKYDTKPISPGESGNLEVVFDTSGRNGMQTKTVTVKSNASTPFVLLKITAEVVTNSNQ